MQATHRDTTAKEFTNNVHNAPVAFRSSVWRHFGFGVIEENGVQTADKSRNVCKLCESYASYKAGNTSDITAHLKREHPQLCKLN